MKSSAHDVFHKAFQPPTGFDTDEYSCFFTDPAYFQSDYEAVIASREELRIWSDSPWPEEEFNPQINREELGTHVQDNRDHSAYGYMLYDAGRQFCYGSIYVNPIAAIGDDYTLLQGTAQELEHYSARVDYWLRSDCSAEHDKLAGIVLRWLRDQWQIPVAFTARGAAPQRAASYRKLGLRQSHELLSRHSGTTLLLYGQGQLASR